MDVNYECCHEELLQEHSLKLREVETELNYKKEKIDEIKDTQKRMEKKIDEIKDCVNKIVLKSKTEDDLLEKRLIAIETEQKVIKELQDKSRSDTNVKIAIVGLIIAGLTFYFNYIK